MKKQLLILCTVGTISGMLAQPTLTQALAYVPGNTTSAYTVDSTGVQPGPGGANQTWNFAGISLGASSTNTALTPSSTPFSSSFPTATVAFTSGGGSYQYWKVSSSSTVLLGQAQTGNIAVYQNDQTIFNYPFTYNTVINDVISSTYTVSGMTMYRNGTSTTNGDGYGTLILPGVTHSNVLRVHYSYTYIDSTQGFPGSYTSTFDNYYWFNATSKDALMAISYINVGGFITKVVSVSTTAVGINEQEEDLPFGLFPNPTSEQSSIQLSLEQPAAVNYTITNALGQQVKKASLGNLGAGPVLQPLDLSGLPAGMYFISVEANGARTEKKLIIE